MLMPNANGYLIAVSFFVACYWVNPNDAIPHRTRLQTKEQVDQRIGNSTETNAANVAHRAIAQPDLGADKKPVLSGGGKKWKFLQHPRSPRSRIKNINRNVNINTFGQLPRAEGRSAIITGVAAVSEAPKTNTEHLQSETVNCSQPHNENDRYSSSFNGNSTLKALNVGDDFKVAGEAGTKKTSSVHVGEDITLCWIETTTIKEDHSMHPVQRLVLREYTISFENSATIPDRYLECIQLEGEVDAKNNSVPKSALFEIIDENTRHSRVVNFTTVSHSDELTVWQHRRVRCGVGPVVTKNIVEWADERSDNPKKRVEIKVSPKIHRLTAQPTDPEPCTSDDIKFQLTSTTSPNSTPPLECGPGTTCDSYNDCVDEYCSNSNSPNESLGSSTHEQGSTIEGEETTIAITTDSSTLSTENIDDFETNDLLSTGLSKGSTMVTVNMNNTSQETTTPLSETIEMDHSDTDDDFSSATSNESFDVETSMIPDTTESNTVLSITMSHESDDSIDIDDHKAETSIDLDESYSSTSETSESSEWNESSESTKPTVSAAPCENGEDCSETASSEESSTSSEGGFSNEMETTYIPTREENENENIATEEYSAVSTDYSPTQATDFTTEDDGDYDTDETDWKTTTQESEIVNEMENENGIVTSGLTDSSTAVTGSMMDDTTIEVSTQRNSDEAFTESTEYRSTIAEVIENETTLTSETRTDSTIPEIPESNSTATETTVRDVIFTESTTMSEITDRDTAFTLSTENMSASETTELDSTFTGSTEYINTTIKPTGSDIDTTKTTESDSMFTESIEIINITTETTERDSTFTGSMEDINTTTETAKSDITVTELTENSNTSTEATEDDTTIILSTEGNYGMTETRGTDDASTIAIDSKYTVTDSTVEVSESDITRISTTESTEEFTESTTTEVSTQSSEKIIESMITPTLTSRTTFGDESTLISTTNAMTESTASVEVESNEVTTETSVSNFETTELSTAEVDSMSDEEWSIITSTPSSDEVSTTENSSIASCENGDDCSSSSEERNTTDIFVTEKTSEEECEEGDTSMSCKHTNNESEITTETIETNTDVTEITNTVATNKVSGSDAETTDEVTTSNAEPTVEETTSQNNETIIETTTPSVIEEDNTEASTEEPLDVDEATIEITTSSDPAMTTDRSNDEEATESDSTFNPIESVENTFEYTTDGVTEIVFTTPTEDEDTFVHNATDKSTETTLESVTSSNDEEATTKQPIPEIILMDGTTTEKTSITSDAPQLCDPNLSDCNSEEESTNSSCDEESGDCSSDSSSSSSSTCDNDSEVCTDSMSFSASKCDEEFESCSDEVSSSSIICDEESGDCSSASTSSSSSTTDCDDSSDFSCTATSDIHRYSTFVDSSEVCDNSTGMCTIAPHTPDITDLIATTKSTPVEVEKVSTTVSDVPTTVESRRSTTVKATSTESGTKHKLALKIKILLEHLDENKKRQKLFEIEKHLLFDENPEEHGKHSLMRQVKLLNNSLNMRTVQALFNCSTVEKLTGDVGDFAAKYLASHGDTRNAEGPIGNSSDSEEVHVRKSRDLSNPPEIEIDQNLKMSLPGIHADIHAGLDHVMSRLPLEHELENRNIGAMEDEIPRSRILEIVADPQDERVYTRRKRQLIDDLTIDREDLPEDIREVGHWSNERVRRSLNGSHVRSLTEFTIYKGP